MNEENTRAGQAEIVERNPGTHTRVLVAAVTDPTQVSGVTAAAKELGGLDMACNNVGIGQWIDSLEMTYEDFEKMFLVNFLGRRGPCEDHEEQEVGEDN